MQTELNFSLFNQLLSLILSKYEAFGNKKSDGKIIFERILKISELDFSGEKTVIPFKKILWPDGFEPNKKYFDKPITFLGLTNCDAQALDILLKVFDNTSLLPKRKDILVVTVECKPTEACFCQAFGEPKIRWSDLHFQKEGKNWQVFAITKKGEELLKILRLKKNNHLKIRQIPALGVKLIDRNKLSSLIDRKSEFLGFWQKIARECFGCGACSAVCPLCFCVRKDFDNSPEAKAQTNGDCQQCYRWDACFSQSFSEIQHHFNFRPEAIDRLYNWYHHKFCRSFSQDGFDLCTGCGRCIEACPAHLNQYRIIESLTALASRPLDLPGSGQLEKKDEKTA